MTIALSAVLSTGIARADDGSKTDPANTASVPPREFAPMTRSERFSNYFMSAFGPEAILTAAASGALKQATNNPKEWGGGAEAYGERVGSVFAQHVIRGTLAYGASAALHEDNRYFASGETGFFRRTKYAVMSAFLARHDNGSRSISFSRIGSAAGAAFISREWQPRSTTTGGDGAMSFGITMGRDVALNVFREFVHLRKK
jgi:hypothetical protein